MNYKRLAIVLSPVAFYLAMVALAWKTGWVVGTTDNAWGNGGAFVCIAILNAMGVVALIWIGGALYWAAERIWEWIHKS